MESPIINLAGLRMNAVETDPNGVIGKDTIFQFQQTGQHVRAEYSGGRIEPGYLVGIITGHELEFRYCQLEADGALNGGLSRCELVRSDRSLIQIIEYFEWESRPGQGRNVIQEMPA